MKKTAVVLFNLGGPDSRETIRPFLFNFFTDKNIIRAPLPVRYFVALLISLRRSKKQAGDSYALLGNKSPLLDNTRAQAGALQEKLGEDYRVFVCMRYWHPMADEVAHEVKNYNPDRIILLPLYPQFSTTTTKSSFESWDAAARKAGLDKPTVRICCYPRNRGFVKASAQNIKKSYTKLLELAAQKGTPPPRILFSAHGLPEDVIKGGDPYQWQCEQTAQDIVMEIGISDLDWAICYQSRVGPKKWIGPSTDELIIQAGKDHVPVIVYPHAFTQEHVETLVEIEIEYRELAEQSGAPFFERVPTVSAHECFIGALADLVGGCGQRAEILSADGDRICPQEFGGCCMAGQ